LRGKEGGLIYHTITAVRDLSLKGVGRKSDINKGEGRDKRSASGKLRRQAARSRKLWEKGKLPRTTK